MGLEWYGPDVLADAARANDAALDAAANVGVASVKQVLGRLGSNATTQDELYRGLELISSGNRRLRDAKSADDRQAIFTARRALRAVAGGAVLKSNLVAKRVKGAARAIELVDPPGGFPRRRTGALHNSITHDGAGGTRQAKPGDDTRRIGPDTRVNAYSEVHEFGNGKVPARPYLRRTLIKEKGAMFQVYAQRFMEAMGL